MDEKKLLEALCSVMAVSGFEETGHGAIKEILAPYFDEILPAGVAGLACISRCGKENAPLLLIDAHMDEIGMIVTDIKDDGLLTVGSLGGIDRRTLTAGEFVLYAKEELAALAVKTPACMRSGNALPSMNDLLLFTGKTKDELLELGVKVGTPIGYKKEFFSLNEDLFFAPSLDDRAAAVAAVIAVEELKGKERGCDICLLFSSQEESFGAGFKTGAFAMKPDEILVVDVDLGNTPETDKNKTVEVGNGPSVAISVQTDRALTKRLFAVAKEREIPCQPALNVRSTGTNASAAPFFMDGVPCAAIGIPLKYMHTPKEALSLKDLQNTGKLIAAYAMSRYGAKEDCHE
jgi:endoglucanase